MKWNNEDTLKHIENRILKTESGCWEWQGCLTKDGYGQFGSTYAERATGQKLVHRAMYVLDTGFEFTHRSQQVMHQCHNRRCCNPDHLKLGTPKENMQAAHLRGSYKLGEEHRRAKLTNADVHLIRQLFDHGFNNSQIGRLFKVAYTTVRSIRCGKTWGHV